MSNFYHNQVLAPTLSQQVPVQTDAGPAVAAEVEARHSAMMNERNEQCREQLVRLQHEAISRASKLRREFLQAETRLQHQEEAVRAAGESMANKHSGEVSQMRRKAMDVKIKLHQAETTVNEVVHHAERKLAAKAQAQSAADSILGQLNRLRSEMTEFLKIRPK